MTAAKLQLSSTASLHAGFIFDQLFVNLSLSRCLSHTEQKVVETPLSIRLRRRSSFPDRCESFLNRAHPQSALVSCSTNKHLTDCDTHTHFSLTSYRLCTSHCSGEHLASCCFVEAFTEPEVACGLCASTELRLIVRRCSESERQRRSQHETRSPAHSHHSPVTESAEQRLKAAAGEHLTPPCRHEPVPPYTGGANSAEARGKHAPWGPSFHDFKLY